MPVPQKNNQGESVLSLSRSQMTRKVKKNTSAVACECDKCGQIATVVPNQEHNYCRGFKVVKPLPGTFRTMVAAPGNRGTWKERTAGL